MLRTTYRGVKVVREPSNFWQVVGLVSLIVAVATAINFYILFFGDF